MAEWLVAQSISWSALPCRSSGQSGCLSALSNFSSISRCRFSLAFSLALLLPRCCARASCFCLVLHDTENHCALQSPPTRRPWRVRLSCPLFHDTGSIAAVTYYSTYEAAMLSVSCESSTRSCLHEHLAIEYVVRLCLIRFSHHSGWRECVLSIHVFVFQFPKNGISFKTAMIPSSLQ